MNEQVIVEGILKSDGSLELDKKPNLPSGRVRVTLASITEPARPERFWAMMEQIWSELKMSGHVPRSVEEIEAERKAFRDEWEERQEAMEKIHGECERLGQQSNQSEGPPQ